MVQDPIDDEWVKIKITKRLLEEWASRTEDGYKLDWLWTGPDEEGFWIPSVTIDYTNKLVDWEGC